MKVLNDDELKVLVDFSLKSVGVPIEFLGDIESYISFTRILEADYGNNS